MAAALGPNEFRFRGEVYKPLHPTYRKRIVQEIKDMIREPIAVPGVEVSIAGYDARHLDVKMPGPYGTAYEGGTFLCSMHMVDTYPYRPPDFRFDTVILHPNVTETGVLMLDAILEGRLTPAHHLRHYIWHIWDILENPVRLPSRLTDYKRPYRHWNHDPNEFFAKAANWTERYAIGSRMKFFHGIGKDLDFAFEGEIQPVPIANPRWIPQMIVRDAAGD